MTETTQGATIAQVKEFFGMDGASMMKEWRELSDKDKTEIKDMVAAEIERRKKL